MNIQSALHVCVLLLPCSYGMIETTNHLSCGHHRQFMVDKFLTHDYHVMIN